MRFPVRPGKVTCAGLVGILMVLPASIWKGPETEVRVTHHKTAKAPDTKAENETP